MRGRGSQAQPNDVGLAPVNMGGWINPADGLRGDIYGAAVAFFSEPLCYTAVRKTKQSNGCASCNELSVWAIGTTAGK